ncbi:MAG: PTS IIA-like nitrogen regulatory protein PtsN [Oleiphilus sp.]
MSNHSITIEAILSPELTQTGLPGGSKKKILQEVAEQIARHFPHLEVDVIFENLIARERLGSTGIGQGIAIPHSRLENLEQVIGCLFTLEEKIDFDSIDNKPVDILFVLIVPTEATSEHLDLLSQIAEKFNHSSFCEEVRSAKSGQDLYKKVIGLV